MSKKKKQNKETTIENYYDLKVDAMDELVAALKGETEDDVLADEFTPAAPTQDGTDAYFDEAAQEPAKPRRRTAEEDGFNPYSIDKFSRIPVWLKAIFIKFWFAGAVCYFVCMGLGFYVRDTLDMLVLSGVVLGLVVDCLVNPIFRMMESDAKEYNNYMMFPFPFKAYWTFFTNIAYYVGICVAVNFIWTGIAIATGLGAFEPLIFGVMAVVADMAFIGIKDLIVYLVKRKKKNKEEVTDV